MYIYIYMWIIYTHIYKYIHIYIYIRNRNHGFGERYSGTWTLRLKFDLRCIPEVQAAESRAGGTLQAVQQDNLSRRTTALHPEGPVIEEL